MTNTKYSGRTFSIINVSDVPENGNDDMLPESVGICALNEEIIVEINVVIARVTPAMRGAKTVTVVRSVEVSS